VEGPQKRDLSFEKSYGWMKHERFQGAQRGWDLRPGCDTGALLYQLSYEALISPVRSSYQAIMCSEWRDEYMRNICGFKMAEEWNNPRGVLCAVGIQPMTIAAALKCSISVVALNSFSFSGSENNCLNCVHTKKSIDILTDTALILLPVHSIMLINTDFL